MLNIIKAYAVNNLCYIAAQKMVPQGIVVHSTGVNNPYLKRYVDAPDEVGINRYGNHWNVAKPGGRKVCVHAFIGYDKSKQVRVAEVLPQNICCWGVGKGKNGSYNYDPAYIQLEICEDKLTDKTYYEKAFVVAAEYCAELCKIYGISVGKIVGHCEAYRLGYGSNHSDPEHWMKNFSETMDDFRNKVSEILKSNNGKTESKQEIVSDHSEKAKGTTTLKETTKAEIRTCPYLVKVTTDCLSIHKGAGTNTAKVGSITDKGVYTIVGEKQGSGAAKWGKLKSGAGWISLDYVKKI